MAIVAIIPFLSKHHFVAMDPSVCHNVQLPSSEKHKIQSHQKHSGMLQSQQKGRAVLRQGWKFVKINWRRQGLLLMKYHKGKLPEHPFLPSSRTQPKDTSRLQKMSFNNFVFAAVPSVGEVCGFTNGL